MNIECHHIVPESEGGPSDFENCIPVCFDCHAEVQHYNPNHPKGTKFSPNELRGHRTKWFSRVQATAALGAAAESSEVDRKVFEAIRRILPSDGSVNFVRRHNFDGCSFARTRLDQLHEFRAWADLPDSEFIDADLEPLRARLNEQVSDFLFLIGRKTFPTSQPDHSSVPIEWADDRPKLFEETVDAIHDAAEGVCKAYDELVRAGRRKLNVA